MPSTYYEDDDPASSHEVIRTRLTTALGYLLDDDDEESDDRRAKLSPSTLARVEEIQNAITEVDRLHADRNIDALEICAGTTTRLNVEQICDSLNMVNAVQRSGDYDLSMGLTMEHINIYKGLNREISNVRWNHYRDRYDEKTLRDNTRAIVALGYRNPEQIPLLMGLIRERHLIEPKSLEDSLREREEISAPLIHGVI